MHHRCFRAHRGRVGQPIHVDGQRGGVGGRVAPGIGAGGGHGDGDALRRVGHGHHIHRRQVQIIVVGTAQGRPGGNVIDGDAVFLAGNVGVEAVQSGTAAHGNGQGHAFRGHIHAVFVLVHVNQAVLAAGTRIHVGHRPQEIQGDGAAFGPLHRTRCGVAFHAIDGHRLTFRHQGAIGRRDPHPGGIGLRRDGNGHVGGRGLGVPGILLGGGHRDLEGPPIMGKVIVLGHEGHRIQVIHHPHLGAIVGGDRAAVFVGLGMHTLQAAALEVAADFHGQGFRGVGLIHVDGDGHRPQRRRIHRLGPAGAGRYGHLVGHPFKADDEGGGGRFRCGGFRRHAVFFGAHVFRRGGDGNGHVLGIVFLGHDTHLGEVQAVAGQVFGREHPRIGGAFHRRRPAAIGENQGGPAGEGHLQAGDVFGGIIATGAVVVGDVAGQVHHHRVILGHAADGSGFLKIITARDHTIALVRHLGAVRSDDGAAIGGFHIRNIGLGMHHQGQGIHHRGLGATIGFGGDGGHLELHHAGIVVIGVPRSVLIHRHEHQGVKLVGCHFPGDGAVSRFRNGR